MMKKILGFVLFFCGLFTLFSLGYWQIERSAWKKDIIDKLDREYKKDASLYEFTLEDFFIEDSKNFKAVRGNVEGRFLTGKTLFWPNTNKGQYGYQLMDPLLLSSGKILMVNRGWVARKSGTDLPKNLFLPPTNRILNVVGLARAVESNYFTLENELTTNQWRQFDPQQIADYLDVEFVLPTVLFAEKISPSKLKTLGDVTAQRIYPRNKHKQYALFWFTLAALWIVIFGTSLFRRKY